MVGTVASFHTWFVSNSPSHHQSADPNEREKKRISFSTKCHPILTPGVHKTANSKQNNQTRRDPMENMETIKQTDDYTIECRKPLKHSSIL